MNHWHDKISWLVKRWWFWTFFCLFFFAYPIARSLDRTLPPELPVLFELPHYQLVDENNENFDSQSLEGRVVLYHFHFLSCPSICPELMELMQKIQKRVRGIGQEIALISISVDPEEDTPQKLFKKARQLKANPYIWKFLTGAQQDIEQLVTEGFMSTLSEKEQISDSLYDIVHSGQIFLVDQEHRVRALFATDEHSINQLMIEIGLLVNRYQNKI